MKVPRHLLIFFLLASLFFSSCGSDLEIYSADEINIAYAEAPLSYSPLSYESRDRKFLANIYEPLVSYDRSFNTKTALAISWGRLDETTWDFRLRRGVVFHDGDEFEADDVVYSLNKAREDADSDLGSLLSSIVRVEKVDTYRVEIETREADPLLLNKLTNVYMMHQDYSDYDLPVGTGPYRLADFLENGVTLERFGPYWGPAPYFPQVNLLAIPRPEQRLEALLAGEVDFLANVPPQFVPDVKSGFMDVISYPSLEVSFLMLNTKGAFGNSNLRTALWYALNDEYSEALGNGYLESLSQYAAKGIFGYVPSLPERKTDFSQAWVYRNRVPGPVQVTLDIPTGLSALAKEIADDLEAINVEVEINILPLEDYEAHILEGGSDFYFFGWKYDLGDVSDFYESVLHSPGEKYGAFNAMNYKNTQVDAWIESAAQILDVQERQTVLSNIAETSLKDHVVVPLFESQVLYGVNPLLKWEARLDGQILASEIMGNVVLY